MHRQGDLPANWVINVPALNVKLFDVNGDGRAEVIMDEGIFSDTALVFEDTDGLALDEFARLSKPQVMSQPQP